MEIKELLKEIENCDLVAGIEDGTGCADVGYDCEQVDKILEKIRVALCEGDEK